MIHISMQFFGGRGSSGKAAGGGGGGKPIVYKEINDGTEANKVFAASYSDWEKSTTNEEKSITVAYTGDYYEIVNSVERQTDYASKLSKSTIASAKENSKTLSSAISKFDLTENIVVYRGVDLDAFGLGSGGGFSVATTQGMKALVGTTFVDKGFMSTTPVSTSAFDYKDAKMIINVPKGKGRGAWVKPISQHKGENECLLQKGSGLKITKVERTGGQWEVYADLVGNGA